VGRSLLDELFDYVRFSDDDARILAEIAPSVRPAFGSLVDEFYTAIRRNPDAHAVLQTEPQIDRLKGSLHDWLEGIVGGVYDDLYLERRERIGRAHVRIKLEPRYVFGAMNLVRSGLHVALDASDFPVDRRAGAHRALDRICDVEVAIMMETYSEGYAEQVRSSERLATIGQLAASIAHELRNPLSVIESSLHILRKRMPSDDRVSRHLDRIGEQVGRSTTIISDLLSLAANRPPNRTRTDVRVIVEDAIASIPQALAAPVRAELPQQLDYAHVDGGQLRQAVANLIMNAIDSVDRKGGGAVTVDATYEEHALVLRVEDEGIGLSPEVRARMFDPLFSTRAAGFGLGLALCREVAERHGGAIIGEERPDGGARFVIRIPDARVD